MENLLSLSHGQRKTALEAALSQAGAGKEDTEEASSPLNWQDGTKHRNHLLHRLAALGDADCIQVLSDAGADINVVRDLDASTPLHLALWHGQMLAAARLKALGARQYLANSYGETALDLEAKRNRHYISWHQQADLIMNVVPVLLRRLFRERWLECGHAMQDVGRTILEGSQERESLSRSVSVAPGDMWLVLREDLRQRVSKGQKLWLMPLNVEFSAASEAIFSPVRRGQGPCCQIPLDKPWPGPPVKNGILETQRWLPETRLPPGCETYRKIRRGQVEDWDTTLLAHFLGDEQCQVARRLLPDFPHRKLVRELRDVRNKAGLHTGRAEIEPQVVDGTKELLGRFCQQLVPGMAAELEGMVREILQRTVVSEDVLQQMEHSIGQEQERNELLDRQLTSASRFSDHLPPGAFGGGCGGCGELGSTQLLTADGSVSEWSATVVAPTRTFTPPAKILFDVEDLTTALILPEGCGMPVVQQCLHLATASSRRLLFVLQPAAGRQALSQVLLEKVGDEVVHKRWKQLRTTVFEVQTSPGAFDDWSLPDGVLVSGEQGALLRVTAQFRPPHRAQGRLVVRTSALQAALDIVAVANTVVVVRDGGVRDGGVFVASSACPDQYFQYKATAASTKTSAFRSCEGGALTSIVDEAPTTDLENSTGTSEPGFSNRTSKPVSTGTSEPRLSNETSGPVSTGTGSSKAVKIGAEVGGGDNDEINGEDEGEDGAGEGAGKDGDGDGDDDAPGDDYDEDFEYDETASLSRGAVTATEVAADGASGRTKNLGHYFWPYMRQREHVTKLLHTEVGDQVLRWAEGTRPVNAQNAEAVAESTSKWLWQLFQYGPELPVEAVQAGLKLADSVLSRLAGCAECRLPPILLPLAEIQFALGQEAAGEGNLRRARRLCEVHHDLENGFSAHHALFRLHLEKRNFGVAKALLVGSQRLLDSEAGREGPGMEEFHHAKQLFHNGNLARLEARLALESDDGQAIQRVQELLRTTTAEMQSMDGSSFRGNTSRNIAELLRLSSFLAERSGSWTEAIQALEQELVLRRQDREEQRAADVLVALARLYLRKADPTAVAHAQSLITEAELALQSLLGATIMASSAGEHPAARSLAELRALRDGGLERGRTGSEAPQALTRKQAKQHQKKQQKAAEKAAEKATTAAAAAAKAAAPSTSGGPNAASTGARRSKK